MSSGLRYIGYYGNGAVALFAAIMVLYSVGRYGFFPVFCEAGVCALAIFNMRMVAWMVRLSSEEEWLKGEVRKAELRKQLAGFGRFASGEEALPVAAAEPAAADATHQPPAITPDGGGGK